MRAGVLVAVVLGAPACVLPHTGSERPGHVELAEPPAALAARGTLPAAPVPSPAVIISGGAMLDGGTRCVATICRGEGTVGLELGLYFTRVTRAEVVARPEPSDTYVPPWQLGLNVGWTPAEARTSMTPVPPPVMYVEAQGRVDHGLYGLAAGVALTPGDGRDARNGFQIAELLGPLYLRQQLLLDGSYAISGGVAVKVPVLVSF
jgi:hypothetical protein